MQDSRYVQQSNLDRLESSTPEKKKELAEVVPVGWLNTAEELGNLIGFLAGGPTEFLTGSTIKIDGDALV